MIFPSFFCLLLLSALTSVLCGVIPSNKWSRFVVNSQTHGCAPTFYSKDPPNGNYDLVMASPTNYCHNNSVGGNASMPSVSGKVVLLDSSVFTQDSCKDDDKLVSLASLGAKAVIFIFMSNGQAPELLRNYYYEGYNPTSDSRAYSVPSCYVFTNTGNALKNYIDSRLGNGAGRRRELQFLSNISENDFNFSARVLKNSGNSFETRRIISKFDSPPSTSGSLDAVLPKREKGKKRSLRFSAASDKKSVLSVDSKKNKFHQSRRLGTRTCGDINGDGTTTDQVDCSGVSGKILTVDAVNKACNSNPCSAAECCTQRAQSQGVISELKGFDLTDSRIGISGTVKVLSPASVAYGYPVSQSQWNPPNLSSRTGHLILLQEVAACRRYTTLPPGNTNQAEKMTKADRQSKCAACWALPVNQRFSNAGSAAGKIIFWSSPHHSDCFWYYYDFAMMAVELGAIGSLINHSFTTSVRICPAEVPFNPTHASFGLLNIHADMLLAELKKGSTIQATLPATDQYGSAVPYLASAWTTTQDNATTTLAYKPAKFAGGSGSNLGQNNIPDVRVMASPADFNPLNSPAFSAPMQKVNLHPSCDPNQPNEYDCNRCHILVNYGLIALNGGNTSTGSIFGKIALVESSAFSGCLTSMDVVTGALQQQGAKGVIVISQHDTLYKLTRGPQQNGGPMGQNHASKIRIPTFSVGKRVGAALLRNSDGGGGGFGQAVTCVDNPVNFLDSDGDGCVSYSLHNWCGPYGSSFANANGITANQACCVCGGGTKSNNTGLSSHLSLPPIQGGNVTDNYASTGVKVRMQGATSFWPTNGHGNDDCIMIDPNDPTCVLSHRKHLSDTYDPSGTDCKIKPLVSALMVCESLSIASGDKLTIKKNGTSTNYTESGTCFEEFQADTNTEIEWTRKGWVTAYGWRICLRVDAVAANAGTQLYVEGADATKHFNTSDKVYTQSGQLFGTIASISGTPANTGGSQVITVTSTTHPAMKYGEELLMEIKNSGGKETIVMQLTKVRVDSPPAVAGQFSVGQAVFNPETSALVERKVLRLAGLHSQCDSEVDTDAHGNAGHDKCQQCDLMHAPFCLYHSVKDKVLLLRESQAECFPLWSYAAMAADAGAVGLIFIHGNDNLVTLAADNDYHVAVTRSSEPISIPVFSVSKSVGTNWENILKRYHKSTIRVVSGTASNSATLAVTASTASGIYIGDTLCFTAGTGSGQCTLITAYNGSSKVATWAPGSISTAPDSTTTYTVTPPDIKVSLPALQQRSAVANPFGGNNGQSSGRRLAVTPIAASRGRFLQPSPQGSGHAATDEEDKACAVLYHKDAPCGQNQRVSNHKCVACASGKTRPPRDDPRGPDTQCTDVDDCIPNPCKNGGTCSLHKRFTGSNRQNYFTCSCPSHAFGDLCQSIRPGCYPGACGNGTCSDEKNANGSWKSPSYKCTCNAGWARRNGAGIDGKCDDNLICAENQKVYNQRCVACPAGKKRAAGDDARTSGNTNCIEINDCTPHVCKHGGTCTDHSQYFTCACPPEFHGTTCQSRHDDCSSGDSQMCGVGGKCVDQVRSKNDEKHYKCECVGGYKFDPTSGKNGDSKQCTVKITCKENERVSKHKCVACEAGKVNAAGDDATGNDTLCDEIDDCLGKPCKNGGTCQDKSGGYLCICDEHHYGTNCDTPHDACREGDEKLCLHGTCVKEEGKTHPKFHYGCVCDHGWGPGSKDIPNCNVDADECQFSNGGCGDQTSVKCTNRLHDTPLCACREGFRLEKSGSKDASGSNTGNGSGHPPSEKRDKCSGLGACPKYALEELKCNDIDECKEGTHKCDDVCKNTVGGYDCFCTNEAHALEKDGRTCNVAGSITKGALLMTGITVKDWTLDMSHAMEQAIAQEAGVNPGQVYIVGVTTSNNIGRKLQGGLSIQYEIRLPKGEDDGADQARADAIKNAMNQVTPAKMMETFVAKATAKGVGAEKLQNLKVSVKPVTIKAVGSKAVAEYIEVERKKRNDTTQNEGVGLILICAVIGLLAIAIGCFVRKRRRQVSGAKQIVGVISHPEGWTHNVIQGEELLEPGQEVTMGMNGFFGGAGWEITEVEPLDDNKMKEGSTSNLLNEEQEVSSQLERENSSTRLLDHLGSFSFDRKPSFKVKKKRFSHKLNPFKSHNINPARDDPGFEMAVQNSGIEVEVGKKDDTEL